MNNEEVEPRYNYILIALNLPREELYERINTRVDIMFKLGLLEEISALKKEGIINENCQSMQAIGYKEFF